MTDRDRYVVRRAYRVAFAALRESVETFGTGLVLLFAATMTALVSLIGSLRGVPEHLQ